MIGGRSTAGERPAPAIAGPIHAMPVQHLLREQLGVIARHQVLCAGGNDNLIERMLRRNEWRAIHPGVYVDHTGLPTPEQQRMAAVLFAWPAALVGESALLAHGVRNLAEPEIRVGVTEGRRVRPPVGVGIQRLRDFDTRVMWNRTPPQLRLEDAALQVASRRWSTAGESGAVAVLADVCQQRFTTAERLREALDPKIRLAGRRFLADLLDDVASGAHSLLEHRYLSRVERAHGLPRGRRQSPFDDGRRHGFRDVRYPKQALLVELDGRLGHEFARDQWADLARDLHAAVEGQLTVRLGWGPVSDACRLAPLLGQLLAARGWAGRPSRCAKCVDAGNPSAPGACDVPVMG